MDDSVNIYYCCRHVNPLHYQEQNEMKERIKMVRQHFGLTQEAFAVRISKTSSYVSNLETGKTILTDGVLRIISSNFGVNGDWLKTGMGNMFISGAEKSAVDKKTMGERIRIVRKQTALTQEEFGERIGFHKNQVHYVEVGKSYPSDDFLWHVAKEFSVNIDWLKSGTGEMKAGHVDGIDDDLIQWLSEHPEVVSELRTRGGLD